MDNITQVITPIVTTIPSFTTDTGKLPMPASVMMFAIFFGVIVAIWFAWLVFESETL